LPVSALRACLLAAAIVGVASARTAHGQLMQPAADIPRLAARAVELESAPKQAGFGSRTFSLLPDDLRARNALLVSSGVLLVATYGLAKWWDEGFTGSFDSANEGWFGANTYAGGADKLGHAMFAYAGTRLLTSGFELVGNDRQTARRLGFWSTLGVMTAIEIADGFSKQYKFSAQDAVANAVGAGLGYLMETNPTLDGLVDFRLLYRTSSNSSFDPAGDYSGQTYLLTVKASGVPALRAHEPLRYLELALGYGTRGFEGDGNLDRKRNLYFGVTVNLSEVLRQTAFRGDPKRGRLQQATEHLFEYIQPPGTAALSRHHL